MSDQQAAAIVGATIGFFLGGPVGAIQGASIGWGAFAPNQKVEGPKLDDLKVQNSSYGIPIPKVYGTARIAGNLIWATDIVETAHTETQGGKGGGGVDVTSYSYSVSFAVALCDGEIVGVRKIWANGKLLYNVSDDASPETIAASNNIPFRLYTGTETQLADSLIEAYEGAGNAPAYRGIAYIVFENLQLADYGNRIPNLEFEVVAAGGAAHFAGDKVDYQTGANPYGVAFDPVTNSIWSVNLGASSVSKINIYTGERYDYPVVGTSYGIAFDSATNSMWVANYGTNSVSKINIYTGSKVDYPTGAHPYGVAFDPVTNSVWVANLHGNTVSKINIYTGSKVDYPTGAYPYDVAFDPVTNSVWVLNSLDNTVSKINIYTGSKVDYQTGATPHGVAFDPVTNSVWVANHVASTVSKIDIYTGSKVDYPTGAHPYGVAFDPVTNSVWVANHGASTVSKIDIYTGSKVDYPTGANPYDAAFDPVTNSIWVSNHSSDTVSKISIYHSVTSAPVKLSTIVSGICTGAGLTTAQIDVTALTDNVHGYVTQKATARAQLQQLMQAFYFDAVESDGKIKFVKRGGAAAVSIPEDDLAAVEYGGAYPDTLTIMRAQDMELPVEVAVQYLDVDAAYQVGTQQSSRLTTESNNKSSTNLAIPMTASKARQIAEVLLYDAWTARTTFEFSTGWKYSYLEPTDVVNVTKDGRTYRVRIIDEDAYSISSRRAVLDDADVYTQTPAAQSLPVPNDTVAGIVKTDLMLLDIPLLRDQDDGVGFYAAACGYGNGWTGAQVFKSNDGGATWSSFGNAMLNAATIGIASTALGDFTQNIFDESNSVTVTLINGTLSSETELNILNGANVALLGDEIIQFKNATLTATNTYTLTGLLRGRLGTEWAQATHSVGDRFVLLSASSIYLFAGTSIEYDLQRQYRGVSFRDYLDATTTTNFTHTAVAKECYAPVHLGGGRNAAGDLTLNWIRRTRIGGGWNNYVDVPLGEAAESYEVEIWDAGYNTLKRTITGLTSPTTTYTAAQQVADFGSLQATVYWKVFQLSADRGRGYEARGTT